MTQQMNSWFYRVLSEKKENEFENHLSKELHTLTENLKKQIK